jgi:hypothetical protein
VIEFSHPTGIDDARGLRSSPVEVDPESEPGDEDGEAEDRAD